jgi:hypothetical protein
MLDKMSRDLREHQKNILKINKAFARKVKGDLKYGFIENLQIVAEHIKNAQKELDNAKKELKQI